MRESTSKDDGHYSPIDRSKVFMRPSLRNRLLFVEQNKLSIFDPAVLNVKSLENFIWKTDDIGMKWIEKTTEEIGDWRSFI